jgi:hypothetical protein
MVVHLGGCGAGDRVEVSLSCTAIAMQLLTCLQDIPMRPLLFLLLLLARMSAHFLIAL